LLGLFVSFACASSVYAQVWNPVYNLGVQVGVVTSGGITYADYTWVMGGCLRKDNIGPVISNGTNFSFNFEIERESGVPSPMFVYIASTNAALGALAPGSYALTTYS
jgi:hypothetical protein